MVCTICTHPQRAQIENALLEMAPESVSVNLLSISKAYKVSPAQLKVHALMHTPLGINESAFDDSNSGKATDSLTRRIKLREADMLLSVANEYMVTLKLLGRKISAFATQDDVMFSKLLSKPMAELYIGVGGEIRNTIKTMAELDSLLNGPPDGGSAGLKALSEAIKGRDSSD